MDEKVLLATKNFILLHNDCSCRINDSFEIIWVANHVSAFVFDIEEAISMDILQCNVAVRLNIVSFRIWLIRRGCAIFNFTQECLDSKCLITSVHFSFFEKAIVFFFFFIVIIILLRLRFIFGVFPLEYRFLLSTCRNQILLVIRKFNACNMGAVASVFCKGALFNRWGELEELDFTEIISCRND